DLDIHAYRFRGMVCNRNSLSQQQGVSLLGDELPTALYTVRRVAHGVRSFLATQNQTDQSIQTTYIYHRSYLSDDCAMAAIDIRQLQQPRPLVAGAPVAYLLLGPIIVGPIAGPGVVWIKKARQCGPRVRHCLPDHQHLPPVFRVPMGQ